MSGLWCLDGTTRNISTDLLRVTIGLKCVLLSLNGFQYFAGSTYRGLKMSSRIHEAPSILRRKAVQARTGLSCSSIYLYMANQNFPKPVKLGPRAVGWIESEISQWLDAQVKQSRAPAKIKTK